MFNNKNLSYSSKNHYKAYQFSIAPMMDCTDRHFRVLMRHISKRALLYTEMIVAQAIYFSETKNKLLDFDDIEHPIAIQLGGDNPQLLAEAARIAENWGYDEINLNIGCPSSRVKAGNFGACLMSKPDIVAKCVESIIEATNLPVTIKHRIGIDNHDSTSFLLLFVDTLASAGAQRFCVHARKAILNGLNPKENRSIPPLQYEKVAYLKEQRPNLIIELNGGLATPDQCKNALKSFDGAMVGRAAYAHPMLWKNMDYLIFGDQEKNSLTTSQLIKKLIPYSQNHLSKNGRLWDIGKHILKLIEGIPNAKSIRKELTEKSQNPNADIDILNKIAQQLTNAGH